MERASMIPIGGPEDVWGRFEAIGFEAISGFVSSAQDMLRDNVGLEEAARRLSRKLIEGVYVDLVIDMARTRKRASEKFSDGARMFFTSEGLRWATPEPAARHCAKRLAERPSVDLTCGQGGQTVFLAEVCPDLLAVDVDPLNCLITRLNLRSRGLEGRKVVQGDCLSEGIIGMARPGSVIFCDPARPSGSPERTLSELVPDPVAVLARYGGKISGACFELPPYIGLEKVPFDHEAEYISLDGRLNRLNVYTGSLKSSPRSAVVLPSGSMMEGADERFESDNRPLPSGVPRYLFEIDPAVVRAGLVKKLIVDLGIQDGNLSHDGRRTLLFLDRMTTSPFITSGYEVLGVCDDETELRKLLQRTGVYKVTLRWSMDPKDYWKRRNSLEQGQSGAIKAHLFKVDRYVLAKKLYGNDEER